MPDRYHEDPQAVSRLTSAQCRVTQRDGTGPAFSNGYGDNKEPAIYVDIVSGEPLFASVGKYDSHSGWPGFTGYGAYRKLFEDTDETRSASR